MRTGKYGKAFKDEKQSKSDRWYHNLQIFQYSRIKQFIRYKDIEENFINFFRKISL